MLIEITKTVQQKQLVDFSPACYKYGSNTFLKVSQDACLMVTVYDKEIKIIPTNSPYLRMAVLCIEEGEKIDVSEFNAAYLEVHNEQAALQLEPINQLLKTA